jgi:short-subunit dehydrogenase
VSLVSGNVLVTGATGGIGQAITAEFAARGARLLLTGRRVDLLERLAREVGGESVVCDLAVAEDVERLAGAALSAGVEVLVANAGLPATGEFLELTQEQIDRMLAVNLRAPIALARALAPSMAARRRGHMVFVASLSSKVASPASSLYAATKFGLRGFALGARQDLRAYGVGVSLVLPGFIRDAGMFADAQARVSSLRLPPGVGTRSAGEVAAAVIRAIERNRAEIDVAPLPLRVGASLGGLAPEVSAAVSRRLGEGRVAADLALAQRDKR